jgi:hypothetical protein
MLFDLVTHRTSWHFNCVQMAPLANRLKPNMKCQVERVELHGSSALGPRTRWAQNIPVFARAPGACTHVSHPCIALIYSA